MSKTHEMIEYQPAAEHTLLAVSKPTDKISHFQMLPRDREHRGNEQEREKKLVGGKSPLEYL